MNLAYIKNNKQFEFYENLNKENKTLIQIDDLKEKSTQLIVLAKELDLLEIEKTLKHESQYCPVITEESLNLSKAFMELDQQQMLQIASKTLHAWCLNQNMSFIENSYSRLNRFKELWGQDRHNFFEELWFFIKQNLGCKELSIIFHDLKEPNEKQKEKGAKNSLFYACVKGEKKQQIFDANEQEKKIMSSYESDFEQKFKLTEFNKEKGQLVACVKINLSPVLILARTNELSFIQESILKSLFNTLQEN